MIPVLNLSIGGYGGSKGKYVEFELTDKDTSIPRQCVQVPWAWYSSKETRQIKFRDVETGVEYYQLHTRLSMNYSFITMFLLDVVSDSRLGDKAIGVDSPTQRPEVQAYALLTWMDKNVTRMAHGGRQVTEAMHRSNIGDNIVFVMDFVESDSFGRYCLVPQDSISLCERLASALAHLEASATPENMRISKRRAARFEADDAPAVPESGEIDADSVEFKKWYVTKLKELIEWATENETDCPGQR